MEKTSKAGAFHHCFLPLRIAPVESSVYILAQVVSGLLPTAQVIAMANFLNAALALAGGTITAGQMAAPLAWMLGLMAAGKLIDVLQIMMDQMLTLKVRTRFLPMLLEKRARMRYAYIEHPPTWDLITQVNTEVEYKLPNGFSSLLNLIRSGLRIGGVVVLIFTQVWWAALVIAVFSLPLFRAAVKGGRTNYQGERDTAQYKRQYTYYSSILADREHAEERTLFGFGPAMDHHYRTFFEKARKAMLWIGFRTDVQSAMGGVLTGLVSIGVALMLLGPVLAGSISVGFFVSLVTAVFSLEKLLTEDLQNQIKTLTGYREYIRDITKYFDLEDERAAPAQAAAKPTFQTLEFRNVVFHYMDCDQAVLNGVSFTLTAGKKYAFVGANGAGKTTAIKLMVGLFDTYEGQILLNGQDIRTMPQETLRAHFAVVFQDFARYQMPLSDNIAVGREGVPVQQVADLAGLGPAIQGLPQGLDTPLGKLSEVGQDLSGGQWQRVAMARAMASTAPVLILDEPTAALDPVAESAVYEEYGRISRGRATIFISHRLGSTKLADEIIVFDAGHVAEMGSHAALLQKNGLFAQMYESQKAWYV